MRFGLRHSKKNMSYENVAFLNGEDYEGMSLGLWRRVVQRDPLEGFAVRDYQVVMRGRKRSGRRR